MLLGYRGGYSVQAESEISIFLTPNSKYIFTGPNARRAPCCGAQDDNAKFEAFRKADCVRKSAQTDLRSSTALSATLFQLHALIAQTRISAIPFFRMGNARRAAG